LDAHSGSKVARVRLTLSRPAAVALARACYLESGWSRSDCAAIAYVVARRAERARMTWTAMAEAYSAIDSGSSRAREISAYPDGDVPGKPESWNRRWADLRAYAARIAAGEVEDPCRGADHWNARNGAEADRAAKARAEGRWALVRCKQATANEFNRAVASRAPLAGSRAVLAAKEASGRP
jgi:hypothetical protein